MLKIVILCVILYHICIGKGLRNMKEKFWVELGNVIKDARIDKRLTQQELADKMNISRNCIGNWESGRRKIDIVELQKLCKALGVKTDDLIAKVEKYVN